MQEALDVARIIFNFLSSLSIRNFLRADSSTQQWASLIGWMPSPIPLAQTQDPCLHCTSWLTVSPALPARRPGCWREQAKAGLQGEAKKGRATPASWNEACGGRAGKLLTHHPKKSLPPNCNLRAPSNKTSAPCPFFFFPPLRVEQLQTSNRGHLPTFSFPGGASTLFFLLPSSFLGSIAARRAEGTFSLIQDSSLVPPVSRESSTNLNHPLSNVTTTRTAPPSFPLATSPTSDF